MLHLILFLTLNFGGLALGAWLMGSPADNPWYEQLNKAPWTPPGWVFGFAWTTIMLLFSAFLYVASAKFTSSELKTFYLVFALSWLLNVSWNPVFFRYHLVAPGLLIIVALTVVTLWFTFWGFRHMNWYGLLMVPYAGWLIVATSLNGYILLHN